MSNAFGPVYPRSLGSRSKQYAIRICLLGEAGSGKSCLFYRVKNKAFRDSPEERDKTSTVSGGPSSRTRFYDSYSTVRRPDSRTKINLTLMDTGSRERYQSLTAQYYKRANVIILVCSLDSEHTLTCLTKWHAEAQYYIDDSNIIYAVVGTKSDLHQTEREITFEMLQSFAGHLNIPLENVFEVSASTGEGVDEMLTALCEAVVTLYVQGSLKGRARQAAESSALLSYPNGNNDSSSQLIVNRTASAANTNKKQQNCCLCCCHSGRCTCGCVIL